MRAAAFAMFCWFITFFTKGILPSPFDDTIWYNKSLSVHLYLLEEDRLARGHSIVLFTQFFAVPWRGETYLIFTDIRSVRSLTESAGSARSEGPGAIPTHFFLLFLFYIRQQQINILGGMFSTCLSTINKCWEDQTPPKSFSRNITILCTDSVTV